jgi:hypothetical protein
MAPRNVTRGPQSRFQLAQLSLDDDDDNNERRRRLLEESIDQGLLLPEVFNDYGRNPMVDPSVISDDTDSQKNASPARGYTPNTHSSPDPASENVPQIDSDVDRPLISRECSQSEPSAGPSSDLASDDFQGVHLDVVDRGDYPDGNSLQDTMPIPPTPIPDNALLIPFDELSSNEDHSDHNAHQPSDDDDDDDGHAEVVPSDETSCSDDVVQSEGEMPYVPSETETEYSRKGGAKATDRKKQPKKTLVVAKSKSAASSKAVPRITQSARNETMHEGTATEASDENSPPTHSGAKWSLRSRAAPAVDHHPIAATQPDEVTQPKKSAPSSNKRVPKPSFLAHPNNLSKAATSATKTTMTEVNTGGLKRKPQAPGTNNTNATHVELRGSGSDQMDLNDIEDSPKTAGISTMGIKRKRRLSPRTNSTTATHVEPRASGSDQGDVYDIEDSPEPVADKTSPQPKITTKPLPKNRIVAGYGRQALAPQRRGKQGLAKPPLQTPAVDPLENSDSPEPEESHLPDKGKTVSRGRAKKEGILAEHAARIPARVKGKPGTVDDVEDVQEELDAPMSKSNTKKGSTGPNSSKKRVYQRNARNQFSSNKPHPKEIESMSGIVHFDRHNGPVRQPQPNVAQDANLKPLQNPAMGAEDIDVDFSVNPVWDDFDGLQRYIDSPEIKPERKSRVRKQSPVEANSLAPALKKPKLSPKVIEQVITIRDDSSSQTSDDGSPNVDSKKPSHLVDVLAERRPASDDNKKRLKVEAARRMPLAELQRPLFGFNDASRREQAASNITVTASAPKAQEEDQHLLGDSRNMPSNQEQGILPQNLHPSNDDVFGSDDNGQRRQKSSFVKQLEGASTLQQQESMAALHPISRVVTEELPKNKPWLYSSGSREREQNLSTSSLSRDARFGQSKSLTAIHPKSQVYSQEISKHEYSRHNDRQSEWNR